MAGIMTIRLIDIEAMRAYGDEREAYQAKMEKRYSADTPSSMDWPKSPKPPDDLVDSRDKGQTMGGDGFGGAFTAGALGSRVPLSGSDLRPMNPIDKDGTMQSKVKGFESGWQCNDPIEASGDHHRTSAPFKLKKG
jgi:hypothetical protein